MGQVDTFREYLLEHPPGKLMVDARTIWVGVECLAEAFEIARKLKLYIGGLEGFTCEGGNIRPDLDAIVYGFKCDGTWDEIVEEGARQIRPYAKILKKTQASFFYFTVIDENQYNLLHKSPYDSE